jgi:hypothetical protein
MLKKSYLQFCLCGTGPGYQHSFDCPFPYYGREQKRIIEWETKRNTIRIEIMEALDPDGEEESIIEYHDYHS